MRLIGLSALTAVLVLAAQGRAEEAAIAGLVTFEGVPVTDGKITFHLPNGQFVGSAISKDGRYAVDLLRPGKYKVTVEGKGVPAKYGTAETSKLTLDVKPGKGDENFDLS